MDKKYMILDMDGVLVEYRKDDKVFLNWEELTETGSFVHRNPTAIMLQVLAFIVGNFNVNIHILSVSPTENTDNEKLTWINNHLKEYVHTSNVHFVRKTEDKVKYMEELFHLLKEDMAVYGKTLNREDIIVVDDTHSILYNMEAKGFTAWHPTTFLNFYYLNVQGEKTVLSTSSTI